MSEAIAQALKLIALGWKYRQALMLIIPLIKQIIDVLDGDDDKAATPVVPGIEERPLSKLESEILKQAPSHAPIVDALEQAHDGNVRPLVSLILKFHRKRKQ